MTEEEKDILQDRVIREEADNLELNQHKALMVEDANYKVNFYLREGIARAAAKEFLKNALETPVISLWSRSSTWQAVAATIIIAAVSTFFLADFRSANEFATAELDELQGSSTKLFGLSPTISRGAEIDWRRAFAEGDYNAIIQNIEATETETKLALGLSKLLCRDECSKDSTDYGQGEFAWMLQHELPEGMPRSQVLWYNSLALYLAGNCPEAIAVLDEIILGEPDWRKKAKKYKRKLERDCTGLSTTIDSNIQQVAEHALLTQLQKHKAHHGCAVLMEVETGNIKAIINLTLQESGSYAETYNYAMEQATEPGSTFKLASLICLLEDGYVDITDSVDIEDGIKKYHSVVMKDSKTGIYDKITVAKAFEISSNVGISKLVNQYYGKNPEKMVDRLRKMGLDQPLGLEIKGEAQPFIQSPTDPSWSGITLPWMSIGYEVLQTPLQILAFYNAIANDGVMVKPKIEKEFPTVVLNNQVCSKETVDKAKLLLEGVVEHGTASNLKHANYKIAGKTGTAQIAKDGSYQASFVGYFPAEKPRYTCIVVVDSPSIAVFYGNLVAGPVFKEISDKVYSTHIKMD
jgi:hypothetical protein